jgi:micrococcal nuclease
MKLYLISVLAILLSSCDKLSSLNAQASIPLSERCEVTNVHDGDTLTARCNAEKVKIRLCGIDSPELKQDWGVESRDRLRSLLLSSKNMVSIIPIEKDRYQRTVAEVFLNDERFVQEELLKSGNAYFYRMYADKCPNREAMVKAEKIAIASRLNV